MFNSNPNRKFLLDYQVSQESLDKAKLWNKYNFNKTNLGLIQKPIPSLRERKAEMFNELKAKAALAAKKVTLYWDDMSHAEKAEALAHKLEVVANGKKNGVAVAAKEWLLEEKIADKVFNECKDMLEVISLFKSLTETSLNRGRDLFGGNFASPRGQ
jgi:hypothetical protein